MAGSWCNAEDGRCKRCDEWSEFTVKDAARRMSRSTRTIERWLTQGIDYRIVDGVILIDHYDLIKMDSTTRQRVNERRVGASW